MSYKEWYNKNVTNYGQDGINKAYKMVKNKTSDKNQYEKYLNVLGKENLGRFANFREIKYNNEDEYKLIKYDYKLRNEALHNPDNVITNIIIPEEKYTKYIFDGNNQKGLIKGKLITDVLGYDKNNYMEFDKLIKDNINKYPKRYKSTNEFGDMYEVNMVLYGLKNRRAKVTIGTNYFEDNYKLTSLYINKLKESELKYDIGK